MPTKFFMRKKRGRALTTGAAPCPSYRLDESPISLCVGSKPAAFYPACRGEENYSFGLFDATIDLNNGERKLGGVGPRRRLMENLSRRQDRHGAARVVKAPAPQSSGAATKITDEERASAGESACDTLRAQGLAESRCRLRRFSVPVVHTRAGRV